MLDTILLIGASVRAAAGSCRRAGINCAAIDRFADEDLQHECGSNPVRRVSAWLEFPERAEEMPEGPWMYTGPLETIPGIVDRISSRRMLLGNSGATLRQVRDFRQFAACVESLGFVVPPTLIDGQYIGMEPFSSHLPWLSKSKAGAGGKHIRLVDNPHKIDRAPSSVDVTGRLLQQLVPGDSLAAVYCANAESTDLLGVTRQWLCQGRVNDAMRCPGSAGPFSYLGSIGPLSLAPSLIEDFQRLGEGFRQRFGLRGLFGIDTILVTDGPSPTLIPVELNPRYTASIEILERALGISFIRRHIQAFSQDAFCQEGVADLLPPAVAAIRPDVGSIAAYGSASDRIYGKCIMYAPRPCSVSPTCAAAWREINDEQTKGGQIWPRLADIPAAGTEFQTGDPVITVFADGANEHAVIVELGLVMGGWLSKLEKHLV